MSGGLRGAAPELVGVWGLRPSWSRRGERN